MTDNRTYRAILFDLDGTLLPMDLDEFLHAYYKRLIMYAAAHGYDPELFRKALDAGVYAMIKMNGIPNEQAFWGTFGQTYGLDEAECERAKDLFLAFYRTEFCRIGDDVTPNPAAREVLEVLAAKGYPLVLATMPLFPRVAVEERLRWAGVDGSPFKYLTTYENSTSAKPHLEYYREVLAAIGVEPGDALMVGNNTQEDLVSMELGCESFLVTDWLIDPIGYDQRQVRHGSMADFLGWARALPPYAGDIC